MVCLKFMLFVFHYEAEKSLLYSTLTQDGKIECNLILLEAEEI